MQSFFQWLKNPLVLWSVGGLIFSLVSIGLWLMVQQPSMQTYFGEVVSVSDTSITIVNRRDSQTLSVTPATIVFKEKQQGSLSLLTPGQFVQVVADTAPDGQVTVTSIRLLKKPPERPRHD